MRHRYRGRHRKVLNPARAAPCVGGTSLAEELKRAALGLRATHFHSPTGKFAYEAAATSPEFQAYRELTHRLPLLDLNLLATTAEKLAFWINLYNALTVHAVIHFRPRWTVWSVPGFFRRAAYEVGGHRFSLDDIEHGVLRANRPPAGSWRPLLGEHDPRRSFSLTDAELDPRVHFALNCASRSCPPIAFYSADQVDAQLDLATRAFLSGETEIVRDRVVTTAILHWYRRDFAPDPSAFLARYLLPEIAEQLPGKRLTFRPYDWRLNH